MTEAARKAKAEYMKAWRAKNKDRIKVYFKNWREANPDKVRAADERYWERVAQRQKEELNNG